MAVREQPSAFTRGRALVLAKRDANQNDLVSVCNSVCNQATRVSAVDAKEGESSSSPDFEIDYISSVLLFDAIVQKKIKGYLDRKEIDEIQHNSIINLLSFTRVQGFPFGRLRRLSPPSELIDEIALVHSCYLKSHDELDNVLSLQDYYGQNPKISVQEGVLPDREGKIKEEFSVVGQLIKDDSGAFYCLHDDGSMIPASDFLLMQTDDATVAASCTQEFSSSAEDADVGAMLRGVREGLGLSTRGGAKTVDVALSQIVRVEKGEGSPRLETLRKFSQAFGFKIKITLHPS